MSQLEQMVQQMQNEPQGEEAVNQIATEQSESTQSSEQTRTEVEPSFSDADVQVTPLNIFERIGAKPPYATVKWLKEIVYGEPGAGKTYHGGTAGQSPLCAPGLIIDVDGGLTTVRNPVQFPNLFAKQVRSMDDLKSLYEELHSAINTETGEFDDLKFVMIDSITELQKIDMISIMAGTKAVLEGRQDPYVPSEREWGISIAHMREIVRKFCYLPCHMLFTAHIDPKKNNRNQMVNGPDLPGKLRNQISGFVDVVGLLYTETTDEGIVRKIQFAKTDTTIAKDRLGVLGQVVVNPTFPMLVEKLREHEGETA